MSIGSFNKTSAVPRPRLTARGVATAAACWALYAVLYASVIATSEAAPFAGVLVGQALGAAVLALLSVPPWLLVVRRMDGAGRPWKVGAHLLIAPLYAWLGLEAFLLIVRWGAGPRVASQVAEQYAWIFVTHAVLYVLQFALYHAVRAVQRLRWKERQAAELAALARERDLAALKAQVNPHFLFNALNSVSAAVRRDPGAARAMLEDLAGLLRYATGRRCGTLATLENELAFARRYLDLEGHRFGARLETHFDIDERALPVRLPPMTLQPLVENAVRHGIARLEEGGAITVRVSCEENDWVRVAVEDTGAGIEGGGPAEEALPEGGTGLRTTSARLRRHFGEEARLHTEERQGGEEGSAACGFRVWFRLPWGTAGEPGAS